jgi:hypothetical protein
MSVIVMGGGSAAAGPMFYDHVVFYEHGGTWTVPDGVTRIYVEACGAGADGTGNSSVTATGGAGGEVFVGTVDVVPGSTLAITPGYSFEDALEYGDTKIIGPGVSIILAKGGGAPAGTATIYAGIKHRVVDSTGIMSQTTHETLGYMPSVAHGGVIEPSVGGSALGCGGRNYSSAASPFGTIPGVGGGGAGRLDGNFPLQCKGAPGIVCIFWQRP